MRHSFLSFFVRGGICAPLRYLALGLLLPLAALEAGDAPSVDAAPPSQSSPPLPVQEPVQIPFRPAGMILYTVEDGKVLLLLADHAAPARDRGWAGFGGMNEPGETTAQTAARETEEETNAYFKQQDLLAKIEGQEPLADGNFSFYFVRVDKVAVADIMSRDTGLLSRFYRERVNFAWIPYAEVERYLPVRAGDNPQAYAIDASYLPDGALATWFWPTWVNNFRVAKRAGRLPWQGADEGAGKTRDAQPAAPAVAPATSAAQ